MSIVVRGVAFTGKLSQEKKHIDCPCWVKGTFEQVPCPWHDGKDAHPIGAFAASQGRRSPIAPPLPGASYPCAAGHSCEICKPPVKVLRLTINVTQSPGPWQQITAENIREIIDVNFPELCGAVAVDIVTAREVWVAAGPIPE